jgi:ribonuclease HI
MEHDVHIYTDGAAKILNGGYGVVMEWVGKPYKKRRVYEGFRNYE